MPRHTYHPADLQPLTGATRVLDELAGMPCIEIRSAGEAFTLLAVADDVACGSAQNGYSAAPKMRTKAR